MNKQTSTLAEQASNNDAPKRAKAKQIFLGIDAHLRSYEVAIKRDNGAIQAAQRFGLNELLLYAHKQLRGAAGLRSI